MRVLPGYAFSLSTAQVVAILVIVTTTAINTFGVQNGRWVQNVLTVAKLAGIVALLILGAASFALHPGILRANFHHAWQPANVVGIGSISALTSLGLFIALCVSQTGSLFSSDSWHDVTLVAAEVKNPRRNLPLSLAIGTSLVTVLYLLCNLAYLTVLPLHAIQTAPGDRVATLMVATVFPRFGAVAMAGLIVVSTFGTVNALTLTGGRACYAMAHDGLFLRRTAQLNRFQVPGWALAVQGLWAIFLVLPRTIGTAPGEFGNLYSNLLDYVISAALLFYVVTVLALFRLRRTRPDHPRPYRTWGYPWLPAFYVAGSLTILVVLFLYRTATTWPGLLVILSGIPVYFFFRARSAHTGSAPMALDGPAPRP